MFVNLNIIFDKFEKDLNSEGIYGIITNSVNGGGKNMAEKTESLEMYLENILVLQNTIGRVRSIDIVHKTGYSKPSVSRALGILKKSGHVIVDENGHLTLTDEGREVAEKIYERHKILTEFLVKIGVNQEVASDDACKIEHHISDESLNAIKKMIEN